MKEHYEHVLLICGGRNISEDACVIMAEMLESYDTKTTLVIQGGAKGADKMAKLNCQLQNIDCLEMRADWDMHGKKAGYIRNEAMLKKLISFKEKGSSIKVIAFWDTESKGTGHMIASSKQTLGENFVEVVTYDKSGEYGSF